MNRISLDQAVREIKLATEHAGEHIPRIRQGARAPAMTAAGAGEGGEPTASGPALGIQPRRESPRREHDPFFFIVGAGISVPSIPLASGIERMCREKAGRDGRAAGEDRGEGPRRPFSQRYSDAFNSAYPHAVARQRYLKELIDSKPITTANLRLAHLLLGRVLTRTVVTSNFDDMLARALALFGEQNVRVCDHPATGDRFNHASDDLRIVHVHGTYWSYDLCNLQHEVEARAQTSSETAMTMVGLLDGMLATCSPLVVGYSGWEGDVIMTALKRRLQPGRRLPYRLYWFCHEPRAAHDLPRWLLSHPDVSLVFHPDSRALRSAETLRRRRSDGYGESYLPAELVFERLMQEFAVEEPRLASDPFGFFADYLERSLFGAGGEAAGRDVYAMRRLIERIREAAGRTDEEPVLEPVRRAAREARYSDVIAEADRLAGRPRQRAQLLKGGLAGELVQLLFDAADASLTGSEEQSEAYRLVIALCEETGDEEALLHASVLQARNLVLRGETLAAREVFGVLSKRFGESEGPTARREMARAAALDRIAGIAGGAGPEATRDLALRVCSARTHLSARDTEILLVETGENLLESGGHAAALQIFQSVLAPPARSDGAPPPVLYPSLRASAEFGRIRALMGLNRRDELVAAMDAFLSRYGPSDVAVIKGMAAYVWSWRDDLGADDDFPPDDAPGQRESPRQPHGPAGPGFISFLGIREREAGEPDAGPGAEGPDGGGEAPARPEGE